MTYFAMLRSWRGDIQLGYWKIMYPSNIVLCDYARYDRKKWNRRRPLSRRIHIFGSYHFACDSYTMRSIGSCRLLTSAIWLWHVCLPVFSLHSAPTKFRRIRIYLFGPILEKYETVFWRVSPQTRLTFALCIGKVIWKIGLVLFARNKH